MVGDRTAGKFSDGKQGSLIRARAVFMLSGASREEAEEPTGSVDRASVVAKKRGNARGAKGRRKVEV